jgi:hypothetical protein
MWGFSIAIRPSRSRTFSPPDSFSMFVPTFSWAKPMAAAAARWRATGVPSGRASRTWSSTVSPVRSSSIWSCEK